MSEQITEQEQLRRFGVYRSLIQRILLRHWCFLLVCFVFFTVLLGIFCAWSSFRSMDRFSAQVRIVHQPSGTKLIPATRHDDVFLLFSRYSMRQDFRTELTLRHLLHDSAFPSVTIVQDRKKTQLFVITCSSRNAEDAIAGANLFWEICRREYANYRLNDIQKMREILESRKRGVERDLDQVIHEEREMMEKSGMARPLDTEHLVKLMVSERLLMSEILVKLSSAEHQQKFLEKELKAFPEMMSKYSRKLRSYLHQIQQLELDVKVEGHSYTETNPRYIVLRSRLETMRQEYESFLQKHHLPPVEEESLDTIERITRELKEANEDVQKQRDAKLALQETLDYNQKLLDRMRKFLPQLKKLESRHKTLTNSLFELSDASNHIDYMESSIANDLAVIELAERTSAESLFSKMNIFVSLLGGIFMMSVVALLFVTYGLRYGKIFDFKELELYKELGPLGAVPDSDKYSIVTEEDQLVLETIFYRSEQLAKKVFVAFIVPLRGGTLNERLQMGYEWKAAMSGRRVCRVTVVKASSFEAPAHAKQMSIVYRRGSHGYLPLENVYVFASSERELFLNDLEDLKKEFDTIVIERQEPLRRHGVFLTQMLKISDACFFMVGRGRTPRSALRSVIALQREENHVFMSVMTGAPSSTSSSGSEY